jgi:hypothetical protein
VTQWQQFAGPLAGFHFPTTRAEWLGRVGQKLAMLDLPGTFEPLTRAFFDAVAPGTRGPRSAVVRCTYRRPKRRQQRFLSLVPFRLFKIKILNELTSLRPTSIV